MRELTLMVQGDLASRLDLCFFGVVVVVVRALLVGLSLMVVVRIVMPMVVEVLGVGLTLMEEQRSALMKNKIICNTPTAQPLAYLHRGIPIVGVPVHPRRGGEVVFFCCSLEVLMVV
jgi:hypothetical protein